MKMIFCFFPCQTLKGLAAAASIQIALTSEVAAAAATGIPPSAAATGIPPSAAATATATIAAAAARTPAAVAVEQKEKW
ncbi:hypothetical protein Emed_002268 [Eimeria media]